MDNKKTLEQRIEDGDRIYEARAQLLARGLKPKWEDLNELGQFDDLVSEG